MLSIKEILAVKPQFILVVHFSKGSIGEMVCEDRDLDKYLAELTIQHYSLLGGACLSFTIECLISYIDELVVIEGMDTNRENRLVYAKNITELSSIDGDNINIYQDDISDTLRDFLIDLIENQPIHDAPNNFIIEEC